MPTTSEPSNTIAALREAVKRDRRPRKRLCRCGEAQTEMVIEARIRERASYGRAGTTATKSVSLCKPCAYALYGLFLGEMNGG